MKYIKAFEKLNTLEVGDYVVLEQKEMFTSIYNDFLKAHIGIVSQVIDAVFYVNFIPNKDDPDFLRKEWCVNQIFNMSALKYHSKSLIDIEKILYAENIYNL
jgi:hypothetical protein